MKESSSVVQARTQTLAPRDLDRIARIRSLGVLGRGGERLDRIAQAAAALMRTPLAAVSVILRDQQHHIAAAGPVPVALPRETSFCTHVTATEMLVVEDAGRHPFFARNPAVASGTVGAYCGTPIVSADGDVVAVLCVVAGERVGFSDVQLEEFAALGEQARGVLLPGAAESPEPVRRPAAGSIDLPEWCRHDPLYQWIARELPSEAVLDRVAAQRTARSWRGIAAARRAVLASR